MRDVSIGQYYAANSVIHRLDPRFKLLAAILFMIMAFFVDTFFVYGVLFIFIITVALIGKLPLFKVLKSLRAVIVLMVFSLVLTLMFSIGTEQEVALFSWWRINIYTSALLYAGLLASRLVLLMLGPSVLTLTTTPIELTDGIESLLKPLTLIKVPVYAFALIMSIALRMVPTLFEETDKIIAAQKARGADFESANLLRRAKSMVAILIPLFISSFRRADDLADAMDSRCFSGGNRTRMKQLKFSLRDAIAVCVMVVLFFMVLFFRYNWWGVSWLVSFRGIIY